MAFPPLDRLRGNGIRFFPEGPGRYRLEANGEIPRGPENVALEGDAELLDIQRGVIRVDRILIELAPAQGVRTGT
jgi:hypothetical protein